MPDETWHDTRVNYAKLVVDLRDQFPYDALTALIVETFANSIDADATKIEIEIDEKNHVFRIIDNGTGMNHDQFVEYHNIASLTKERGETIGFAGVGAKIFLDRAEYIITETKSDSYCNASEWVFNEDSKTPKWRYIETKNRVKSRSGTYVEVRLSNFSDCKIFTDNHVRLLLQEWYNAVLLGYYNVRDVFVNGEKVKPWQLYPVENEKTFDFVYEGNRIRGFFIKTVDDIPDVFQGPHIIVKGKTVEQNWFKQFPMFSNKITGLVLADHLIHILTASKARFKYKKRDWKRFNAKMSKVFSDWLSEINAKPQIPQVDNQLQNTARMIERSINDILKDPLFSELTKDIFQNILKKTVGIKSSIGKDVGILTPGKQITTGTVGGEGTGGGVVTHGDEEGVGVEEKSDRASHEFGKETPIEKVKRRVKGGIKIGFADKPDEIKEVWIDPAESVIIINTSHPAFVAAYAMGSEPYHMMRCIIKELLEEAEIEDAEEKMHDFFATWNSKNQPGM